MENEETQQSSLYKDGVSSGQEMQGFCAWQCVCVCGPLSGLDHVLCEESLVCVLQVLGSSLWQGVHCPHGHT